MLVPILHRCWCSVGSGNVVCGDAWIASCCARGLLSVDGRGSMSGGCLCADSSKSGGDTSSGEEG